MHIVRLVFAVLLALLAVLIVVGQIGVSLEDKSVHILEHIGVFAFALCTAASSFYYFRPRAFWDARLTCPSCHRQGELHLSALGQPHLSIPILLLGGIVGSLLFSHARKHRFHCAACDQNTHLRTVGGWIAAAWLLYLVFALAVTLALNENDR